MDFIRSRIQRPHFRAELIDREGLEEQLGRALASQRLVLLLASAGNGKTVALVRQLERMPVETAVAWITADAELDLPSFFRCLGESLDPYDPPWRVMPGASIDFEEPENLRKAASELLDVLGAMNVPRGVIALDDMHAIQDARVFEFIDLLLEGLPPSWTLAIASRIEPPLALARLRASRAMVEFRQADLRFSVKEIQRLCSALRLDDSSEAAHRLFERTQGWAVGICLSLDAWGGRGETTATLQLSNRHLFEYLATEVFDRLPEAQRNFLMDTSMLENLSPAQCALVSENPHAERLLGEIAHRDLLVSVLDGEGHVLRLHSLARAYLEHRLQLERPEKIPVLLRRAAGSEADSVRRVDLYLRAGAFEEAESAFMDAARQLLTTGFAEQISQMVKRFPQALQENSAALWYGRGLYAWTRFEYAIMSSALDVAIRGFAASQRPVHAERSRALRAIALGMQGSVGEARTLWLARDASCTDLECVLLWELVAYWDSGVRGPAEAPGAHLRVIAEHLLAGASTSLWYLCLCVYPLTYWIGRPGVCEALERISAGGSEAAGSDCVLLQIEANRIAIWVRLWKGELAKADEIQQQVLADCNWVGAPLSIQTRQKTVPALTAAMRSDAKALQSIFEKADHLTHGRDPAIRRVVVGIRALCSAAVEDWRTVRLMISTIDARLPFWGPFKSLLEARMAMDEGRDQDAIEPLEALLANSAEVDRFGLDAQVRIALAIARQRLAQPALAWQAIQPLAQQARGSEEIGGILLCGLCTLVELAQGPWTDCMPQQDVVELQRWARVSEALKRANNEAHAKQVTAPHIAPRLTVRELQVLAFIVERDSNKVIARKLNLSPHTVKRHVARILDRLQLASRAEAAAWYVKRANSALPEQPPSPAALAQLRPAAAAAPSPAPSSAPAPARYEPTQRQQVRNG
ncbi:Serine/threonine-protein kinase PknK [Burkholderiales bacterium 8X]|nr:Serine/threonine-protein kinase PknK [Burkholderiales bacterium 8X]